MSHPIEAVKVDSRVTAVSMHKFSSFGGACGSGSDYYAPTYKVGKLSARYRDASHSNPKDAFGWRNPSPYQGSRTEATWGEVQSCYATSTNCSWEYIQRWSGKGEFPPYQPMGGLWAAIEGGAAMTPIDGLHTPPSWMTNAVVAELTNRALINLKERKVNLAVTLAERQKAADAIVHRIADLVKLARDARTCLRALKLRRGRRGPVPECTKVVQDLSRDWDLPSLWLEYQYGWRPILSDIYGIIEALQNIEGKSLQRYRVRGRAQTARFYSNEPVSAQNTSVGSWPSAVPVYETVTKDGRWYWKVRIDCVLNDNIYRTMSDVGIFDPQLVAWELLPYSFVIDWLIRVGQYLDAVNAYNGLTFTSATTTVGGAFAFTKKVTLDTGLSPCGDLQVLSSPKTLVSGFRRTVSLVRPEASLVLDYTPLSLERLISGISLLAQSFGLTARRWW